MYKPTLEHIKDTSACLGTAILVGVISGLTAYALYMMIL